MNDDRCRNRSRRLVAGCAGALIAAGVLAQSGQATAADRDPLPQHARIRLGSSLDPAELPAGAPPSSSLRGIVFAPDGRRVVTFGEPADPRSERVIAIWDAVSGTPLQLLKFQGAPVRDVEFFADGRKLISVSEAASGEGETRVWDLSDPPTSQAIASSATRVSRLPETQQAAIIHRDQIRVFDLEQNTVAKQWPAPTLVLAVSADVRHILGLSFRHDSRLRMFDIVTGKQLVQLDGCRAAPRTAVVSPDGRTIAACEGDRILFWETAHAESLLYEVQSPGGQVLTMGVAPDARYLATGHADGTSALWNIATGERMESLSGHAGPVSVVRFSPLGDALATGSFDRTALLWDIEPILQAANSTRKLTAEELDSRWSALRSADSAAAYRAIGQLVSAGDQTVDDFARRLQLETLKSDAKQIRKLIADLDDEDYATRERASADLIQLLEVARGMLDAELQRTQSAEVRYRLRRILALEHVPARFSSEDLRRLGRVLQALEQIGTEPAGALIAEIAARHPNGTVIADAQRTLQRLQRRLAQHDLSE